MSRQPKRQRIKQRQTTVQFLVPENSLEHLLLEFLKKHPLETKEDLIMRALKGYYLCQALCFDEHFQSESDAQRWLQYTSDALQMQKTLVYLSVTELENCRKSGLANYKPTLFYEATLATLMGSGVPNASEFSSIQESTTENNLGMDRPELAEMTPDEGQRQPFRPSETRNFDSGEPLAFNPNGKGDSTDWQDEDDELVFEPVIPDFGS